MVWFDTWFDIFKRNMMLPIVSRGRWSKLGWHLAALGCWSSSALGLASCIPMGIMLDPSSWLSLTHFGLTKLSYWRLPMMIGGRIDDSWKQWPRWHWQNHFGTLAVTAGLCEAPRESRINYVDRIANPQAVNIEKWGCRVKQVRFTTARQVLNLHSQGECVRMAAGEWLLTVFHHSGKFRGWLPLELAKVQMGSSILSYCPFSYDIVWLDLVICPGLMECESFRLSL